MRVLVCGGRGYSDWSRVCKTLDALDADRPITLLIHGAAAGADRLGEHWADCRLLQAMGFPAKWRQDGAAAGPIRNARMLAEGKPDLVVAFPGGKGTANMVKQAREAGVEVVEIPCGEGG